MSELTFARQYLHTLDTRPIKLSSDHVQDPRTLPAQPAYILPRNPHPYTRKTHPTSSSSTTTTSTPQTTTPTLTITLKPLRGPTTTLPNTSCGSSIYDLKTRLAERTGYDADKIKVLWGRKPVGDVKTLVEVLGEVTAKEGGEVEMGVMYVGQPVRAPRTEEGGGAGSAVGTAAAAHAESSMKGEKDEEGDTAMTPAPAMPDFLSKTRTMAAGKAFPAKGKEILGSNAFWNELYVFVEGKVGDWDMASEACGAFWSGYRQDKSLH